MPCVRLRFALAKLIVPTPALSREEGIIPALESAHALAYALRRAERLPADKRLLVNLSGRGDKDIDYVLEKIGLE